MRLLDDDQYLIKYSSMYFFIRYHTFKNDGYTTMTTALQKTLHNTNGNIHV